MAPLDFSSVQLPRAVAPASNATDIGLDVVCAWPVSGQYGPGTRVLYYVLIAACVFARKEEWLRNACLAGALLFPAIAALHGIVLAAIHRDGAIDMDVYGAFQLCSIGMLTAPLTARMSGTYFKDPRRNIIFLWTGLVLAGLLSITVELFRVKRSTCTEDDQHNPISSNIAAFPYEGATCGLRCSTDDGPFSPIRVGSANEIYVIPSPNKLTFGTATLLAAGCCVPAIVSLIYFWSLILQDTWNKRVRSVRGVPDSDPRDEPIDGTNGATVGKMLQINGLVRTVLSTVEAPVFAAAVLAILILGEKNFFSRPVDYGTEPIATIGQWAPIVGAGFAILGSLYLYVTGDDPKPNAACKCSCHDHNCSNSKKEPSSPSKADQPPAAEMTETTSPEPAHVPPLRRETEDVGNRRGINRALMRLATHMSIAAHDRLHDYEFKQGPALDFPEIPAEGLRNEILPQIREVYNHKRDSSGNITLSRTGSNLSMASWRDAERSSTASRGTSPRSPRQSARSRSPSPLPSSSRAPDEHRGSSDQQSADSITSSDPPIIRPRKRTNTLEVPPHHGSGSIRRSPSISSFVSASSFTIPGNQASPTIVVSADDDSTTSQRGDAYLNRTDSSGSDEVEVPVLVRYSRRFTS
ncbi:hypothetical protein BDV06DRAFT_233874 [Aspergillus oleicola]